MALKGVGHIIHAGDIGDSSIVDELGTLAPLTAIRGNIDRTGATSRLPATEMLELDGHLLYVLHALPDLDLHPKPAGIAAVIYGHSHKPTVDWKDGVLYLNPGSAGPRRFSLPVTVALLDLQPSGLQAEIVPLPVSPAQKF